MKIIIDKLKQQEEIMANEKGPFDLFALFLREDAPLKWDLVVAAEWIDRNKEASFKYVASVVQTALSTEELLKLSRIVLIDEGNPALEALWKAVSVEHKVAEIKDCEFFGLQIKHAYLITCRRRMKGAPNNAISADD